MSLEPLAPPLQRQAAHIVRPVAQEIEGDERGRLRAVERVDVVGALHVDASLQSLEAGRAAARVERDDFAVDEQRRHAAARASGSRARTTAGNCAVLSLPRRDQIRMSAARWPGARCDQRPDAVVFRFEDQPLAGERRLGQGRQHRADGRGIVAPGGHSGFCNSPAPIPNPKAPNPNHPNAQSQANSQGPMSRNAGSPWEFWELADWELDVGIWSAFWAIVRNRPAFDR